MRLGILMVQGKIIVPLRFRRIVQAEIYSIRFQGLTGFGVRVKTGTVWKLIRRHIAAVCKTVIGVLITISLVCEAADSQGMLTQSGSSFQVQITRI